MYAEAMFLLLALLAFRDVRDGRYRRAALWGVLLGLTRPTAIAVAPALFLAALEPREGDAAPASRRLPNALLVGAAPFVTVWVWIFGDGIAHGEPGLFFRSMAGWKRGPSSLSGVGAWFDEAGRYFGQGIWRAEPIRLLDYVCAVLFVLIAVRLLVRRRWSDAAWVAGSLALPMSTGLSAGMPRYLFAVYPVFFELDAIFDRAPRARVVFWSISGAVLLWAAARFVNALGVS
jgi:hypothetical protein